MQQISFYLEKFKAFGLDSVLVKRVFIETVRRVIGVEISPDALVIRENTLYVKAYPALKSEIYIKHEELVGELGKLLGPTKLTKLR